MKKIKLVLTTLLIMTVVICNASNSKEAAMAFNSGKAKFEKNDYKGAIKDLTIAIGYDATDANVFFYRGRAYFQLGKNSEAISDYTVAIALNPKNAIYYYEKALALADQEDFKLAYREMNKAIEFDKNNANYYFVRGTIEMEIEYKTDARDDFEKAATLGHSEASKMISAR
jgi:tetratricopeptide (TPR) repeat protein